MIFITEMNIYRMGIPNVSSIGKENFGVLDELGYSYEGNQLFSIDQLNEGVDFYGRTGYAPESGTYTWNEAGLLNSDSSRGILSTTYNHQGLPVTQVLTAGLTTATTSTHNMTYSADGTLLRIVREAKVGASSSFRDYSGSRIFENGLLEYSYFPGGYFDSTGAAHYCHTDLQGSIIAVTDSTGTVVQTVGYYPYGEPWREPSGQPMLFAGKERTPQADYLFGPRSLCAATGLWSSPDRFSIFYSNISPYSYCAGNPVNYIDPSGMVIEANSLNKWTKLTSSITNALEDLEDKVSQIENQEWTAVKKEKKIGDKKERIASLKNTLSQMKSLENSNQVYSLNQKQSAIGSISYNKETDIISINYANTSGFVHEVTHAAQYEAGDLGFTEDGFVLGQDIFDERAAYVAQYAYQPSVVSNITSSSRIKRISDITVDWVQNITVGGINPYAPGGENMTGISPLNINSGYDEIIKAYPFFMGAPETTGLLKDVMYKYKK